MREDVLVRIAASTESVDRAMTRTERQVRTSGNRMTRQAQRIGRTFNRALGGITKQLFSFRGALIAAASPAALGLLVKRSLDFADGIAKTADRVGVSTDALQEFRFVASQTGVDIQLFETALTAMVRRAGEAAQGNKAFAEAFKQVGVSAQDLARLRPEEIFNRVADGLARIPNTAQRVAVADRIFSEAGRRIINVFDGGADAINRLREEARDLGIVMSEDLLRSAEDANDRLDILGRVLRTRVTVAVVEHAESIDQLAQSVIDAIPKIAELIGVTMRWLGIAEGSLAQRLADVNRELEALEGKSGLLSDFDISIGTDPLTGDPLFETVEAKRNRLLEERSRLMNELDLQRKRMGRQSLVTDDSEFPSLPDPDAEKAAKELAERFKNLMEELRPVSAAMDEVREKTALLDKQVALGNISQDERNALVERLNQLYFEQTDPLGAVLQNLEREHDLLKISKDERSAHAEILEIENRLRAEGVKITEEQRKKIEDLVRANHALREAERKTKKTTDEFADDAARSVTNALEDMTVGGQNAANAIADLDQAIANLIFRLSVLEPLEDFLRGVFGGGEEGGKGGKFSRGDAGNFVGGILEAAVGAIGGLFGSSGTGFSGANPGNAATGFANPAFPGMTGRAEGGPVGPGRIFRINEKEPEFLVNPPAGTVIPLSKMEGMGRSITLHQSNHFGGMEPDNFGATERQISRRLGADTLRAIGGRA